MHGNNPTRDSIENAFRNAAANGLIKSWEALALTYANAPKWRIELNPGAVGPQGGGTMEIRTYQEGKLVCSALASAQFGAQKRLDAWAEEVDRLRPVMTAASTVLEQALTAACLRGQILAWRKLPGSATGWEIRFNDRKAGPRGDGIAIIHTYQEAKLFAAALASATTIAADAGSLAGQLAEQLDTLGEDYDEIRARLDDGDADLDLFERLHITLARVLTAAGRLG